VNTALTMTSGGATNPGDIRNTSTSTKFWRVVRWRPWA
jgi:hypothetical protein